MRTKNASQLRRLLARYEERARKTTEAGLLHVHLDDSPVRGPLVSMNGREVVSFGSCSYLAVNTDPRLEEAAIRAVRRYGVTYSSSAVYTSLDLYRRLEELLGAIVGGHAVVTPTTTLGHLAALPVIVGPDDTVLVDAQTHASVHMAVQLLKAEDIPVETLPHNDLAVLVHRLEELTPRHEKVWYMSDGVFSMFGDAAPIHEIRALLDRFGNLHLYLDDAHGFSWNGLHGRGWVRDRMEMDPRLVVAVSLSKSFGSGGGALLFGDRDLGEQVRFLGGPLTFGGPLQVAELAAGVASAEIHLSPEHARRRAQMESQLDLVIGMVQKLGLPVMNTERTPVWFFRIGKVDDTIEVGRRMLSDGFYLNPSSFPAVPIGMSGLRVAHTLHHSSEQIKAMLERLAIHTADVVGEDLRVEIDLRQESPVRRSGAAS